MNHECILLKKSTNRGSLGRGEMSFLIPELEDLIEKEKHQKTIDFKVSTS